MCIQSLNTAYKITFSSSNILLDLEEHYMSRGMKQQSGPHIHHCLKFICPMTLLCRPNPNRIEVPVCSSWYLRPPPFSSICLFTLTCFHVQLHWTQTSEQSSFVALTTRGPLIWWLSHWCIDGTEPVSLPASLSPSLQLRSYIDSLEPPSGLIKAAFTCQLRLLVFQVWWL